MRALPTKRLRETLAPSGAGPPAAKDAVASYGAVLEDSAPPRARAHQLGGRDSCLRSSRGLWSTYGGLLSPSARAHQLGGWGILPRRWSLPMVHLRGKATPISAGPRAGGTGSPSPAAVAAYGSSTGDGNSHRRGPSWRDRESRQGGGRCLWNTCGIQLA